MALNRNSTPYVVGFVIVITVICAFIISSAASLLKPAQQLQIASNVQRNILQVSQLAYTDKDLVDVYNSHVEVRYVDRQTGEFTELPAGVHYDELLTASKYQDYRSKLTNEQNLPGLKDNLIANILRVYLIKDDQGQVNKVILPFYGNGLWSVMYGFLAVAADGNTVNGIIYYSQGETPGLGGEVENPNFTGQFIGKTIYEQGQAGPQLRLVKSADTNSPHQVNALSGATLTSNGVNNQLTFWLGEQGYEKFLNNLSNGKVKLNEQ